jgi:hypothetical protein
MFPLSLEPLPGADPEPPAYKAGGLSREQRHGASAGNRTRTSSLPRTRPTIGTTEACCCEHPAGLEPAPPLYESGVLPDEPRVRGRHGGTRTRTLRFRKPASVPIGPRAFVLLSTWQESNLRPSPCRGAALPLSHRSLRFLWLPARDSNSARSPYQNDTITRWSAGTGRPGGTRTLGHLHVTEALCR